MHFDPEQLRVFSALMTEGSTSRASLELRTSRSNVRRIWQNLEEQLGESLFLTRDNGETEPTTAARRLDREMNSLLEEVRRFEATIRKIHQNGRVLRLGADRNLFNTGHFGRIFNTLRHDPRFRISFLEVGADEGKAAVESGACDLLFSIEGVPGRRLESRELPPMALDVACFRDREDPSPVQPEELSNWSWSLATITGENRALDTLNRIRKSGGGEGHLCSQHHFMRWAENAKSAEEDAVVCVRPVSFRRLPQVTFLPLGVEASYPLNVSYLKQHPYEFLETMVGHVDRALKSPENGLRSSES
ncbi:LysR family transcriptional regulator [Luteolibacter flavescens]|uniref:LysR family transcriptional regulator n=1 Tax=Luteolibacter flavescens TaxID=1859460 RepID=A0ABT3FLT0_9BACT|nr:LysR family transcriptional regulator [Luteolibacter flavescens]MCW1883930.1 LysR family transcriptional regulator [Luteolibacter flavescens]